MLPRILASVLVLSAVLAPHAAAQAFAEPPVAAWSRAAAGAPAPDAPSVYSYDDGTPEQAIGLGGGGEICWMLWFDPIGGADTLTQISSMNGRVGSLNGVPLGTVGAVGLWDDPDSNGNPGNVGGAAVLLEMQPWTVQFKNMNVFEPVPISPTIVTSQFFIGAWLPHANGMFPAPLDNGMMSMGRAWYCGSNNPALPFNPKNLNANSIKPQNLDNCCAFNGLWCLRAEGTGSAPVPFCTAKTGLACGVPGMSASGVPSATAGSGFVVSTGPARSCKSGILLYNTSAVAGLPFQGGTLCVDPMGLRRAGSTSSMGTPGGASCDGLFAIDMNTFAAGAWLVPNCDGTPSATPPNNPAPFLSTPGTQVHTQWWGRDSVATGSFVSAGLRYDVGP